MRYSSQITRSAVYYLNRLYYIIGKIGDTHLEIIRSMRTLAASSIHNGGDDLLTLYFYSEMVKNSEKEKFFLLYREINESIADILNQSIQARVSETGIKVELDRIQNICTVIMERLKEGDALLAFLPLIDVSPGFQNNIYVMVTNLLNLKNDEVDDFSIGSIERHTFDTVPLMTGFLLKVISLAVNNKNSSVFKHSINTFYQIVISLLKEKLHLELDFNDEVRHMIKVFYSFFTRFFTDDESLDDSLLDDTLDVLTRLALDSIILDNRDLALLLISKLLEASFHVAKIDKFGYEVPRIAKRIMMIGVLAIEMDIDLVTKKVLSALQDYDVNIKSRVKEFHPRDTVDELKKEINSEELIFESEISPKIVLKEMMSDRGWSESTILNASYQ